MAAVRLATPLIVGAATKLSKLAGGRGIAQRLLPRTYARLTGAPKPELAPYGSRVSAGFQEGLERLGAGVLGRRVPALASARASRAARPFGRPEAVGLSARAASYLPYAAPFIAAEETARRGYNRYRDRQLPDFSELPSIPSSEDRIQEIINRYQQSVIDPQMAALDQFIGGGWEDERRARAEGIIDMQQQVAAGLAGGTRDAYASAGRMSAADAEAIARMAELQGQLSDESIAAGRAGMEAAIYDESLGGDLEGLAPVSGMLADSPELYEALETMSARDALSQIRSEGIDAGIRGDRSAEWGDMFARDLERDAALQAFGARQNVEGSIAQERARREEMRLNRELDLQGGLGGLTFELEQALVDEKAQEDESLRQLLSNDAEVQRLRRVWRDLTSPASWRVGPLGARAERQLALYQAIGINTFDDFLRAQATGRIQA